MLIDNPGILESPDYRCFFEGEVYEADSTNFYLYIPFISKIVVLWNYWKNYRNYY